LVEAGDKGDILRREVRLGPPQRVIIHAERRAAVAGDEPRGLEAACAVALALQHRQPDQRLDAGEIDPLGLEPVFVVQLNLQQGHLKGLHVALICYLAPPAGRGRIASKMQSGWGDSPRTEFLERAPHPSPLPAKSGARECSLRIAAIE